jgi:hypothetical protein
MSEKNIYQRILSVMAEVAYIKKEDKKVNNQYTFVSHDEVSRVLHPMLVKHGIVVTPSVTSWSQDGNRTSADVTVSFVSADKPEDRVDVHSFGFGIDPQDKGPGKAVSYATKYAMLKTFVLETGDDPERDLIPFESAATPSLAAKAQLALDSGDWVTLCRMNSLDSQEWLNAWRDFPSASRKAIKEMTEKKNQYRDQLNALAESNDLSGFDQLQSELSKVEAKYIWTILGDAAKDLLKELQKKAA